MFWYISDLGFLFFFQRKTSCICFLVLLTPVILLFLLTCSFPLSFFLLHSFSALKFHHLISPSSFSCWLSSTYDLIWIFVAFLTATGVVILKSDFAIQYQNYTFKIRYLTYSTRTLLYCRFFLFFLFIFIYWSIYFLFCFDFFSLAVLYSHVSHASWPHCCKQEPIRFSESG